MSSTNLLPPNERAFLFFTETGRCAVKHPQILHCDFSYLRRVKRDFKKWSTTRRKNPQRRKDEGLRRGGERRASENVSWQDGGHHLPRGGKLERGEPESARKREREKSTPATLYRPKALAFALRLCEKLPLPGKRPPGQPQSPGCWGRRSWFYPHSRGAPITQPDWLQRGPVRSSAATRISPRLSPRSSRSARRARGEEPGLVVSLETGPPSIGAAVAASVRLSPVSLFLSPGFQSALRPFSASTLHTLFRRSRGAVTARAFSQPPLAGESFPSSVVAGASRRSKWWSLSVSGAYSALGPREIQPRSCVHGISHLLVRPSTRDQRPTR